MQVPRRFVLIAFAYSVVAQAASNCTGGGVEIPVLGSGGPEMQDKRASSSYLIWRNGKARLLVDAGGGSALRCGQAGGRCKILTRSCSRTCTSITRPISPP
jgi:hypothetical protein